MNKHSLEIPLYLNQKIVFDLLASINDGFTQVTKLKTAATTGGNIDGTIEADLGNKNTCQTSLLMFVGTPTAPIWQNRE